MDELTRAQTLKRQAPPGASNEPRSSRRRTNTSTEDRHANLTRIQTSSNNTPTRRSSGGIHLNKCTPPSVMQMRQAAQAASTTPISQPPHSSTNPDLLDAHIGFIDGSKAAFDWRRLDGHAKSKVDILLENAIARGDTAKANTYRGLRQQMLGTEKDVSNRHRHELEWRQLRVYCLKHLGIVLHPLDGDTSPLSESQLISYFEYKPSFINPQ
jgi:hypothetical protein